MWIINKKMWKTKLFYKKTNNKRYKKRQVKMENKK